VKLGLGSVESYINFYKNGAAVIFLRELVVTGLCALFFSALLVYPLEAGAKALQLGWVQRHAFEIFYYTHVAVFTTIAVLAFSSRFEVFYPALPMWGWYFLDVLCMRFFHTSRTTATASYSGEPTHFVHLKVNKRGRFCGGMVQGGFHFQSGQTAFVNIPAISKLEWHPFSIASAPDDEHVEFLIDAGKYGPASWTGKLWNGLADKVIDGAFRVNLMGPCGSAFQTSSLFHGVVLVGGGSGLTSSLSVLRDIVHKHRSGAALPRKVWLVWVTRHVDSMIWCWDALKRALEGEGTREEKQKNVRELSAWLDVSIHVTGCARIESERKALDRLVASEQGIGSEGMAGSWLVHGDHLHRNRVKSWRAKLLAVHAAVPAQETVKVCFCGPTPMAHAISAAAGTIEGFSVQVSSENFNEGKRPTPKPAAVKHDKAGALTSVFDQFGRRGSTADYAESGGAAAAPLVSRGGVLQRMGSSGRGLGVDTQSGAAVAKVQDSAIV
jgi:NAD(P)H-flavin reductase